MCCLTLIEALIYRYPTRRQPVLCGRRAALLIAASGKWHIGIQAALSGAKSTLIHSHCVQGVHMRRHLCSPHEL